MFKKEKLNQAEEGLPPLDFPLDQFDLALYFKDVNTPIYTIIEQEVDPTTPTPTPTPPTPPTPPSHQPTKASPIQFGTREYGVKFDVIELKSAKLDFDGTHITGIQLGYDSPFPTTDESYFTTCITASGEEWDTWYTDSELTRIDTNYFDESEIPKLTNQWLYINFDVDGGG